MTAEQKSQAARQPRVIELEDIEDVVPEERSAPVLEDRREIGGTTTRTLTAEDVSRGIRWGGIFVSASLGLASLAAGLWFTRFVSIALDRQDWIGWTAFALMSALVLALVAILLRELIGFSRLARLSRLRSTVASAIASGDAKSERKAVRALVAHYRGRPDLAWGVARISDHIQDVLAPGELIRLADREVLSPIDGDARRVILQSGKRVATVTALSPILWLGVVYVLVENVRMFRALSALYGGRPGVLGAFRLARNVVVHIVATGGMAMTDDLLGQFVGQDVLRRLSRRLGEGAFNGALTARLGVVAVEVIRPVPFLDKDPLRAREIFIELFRSLRGATVPKQAAPTAR